MVTAADKPLDVVLSVDLEVVECLSRFSNNRLSYMKGFHDRLTVLLSFLEENRIRATFFVEGFLASMRPDVVKEVRERGHEIACHSFSHKPLIKLPKDEIKHDLKKALIVLNQITGEKPLGFRAPRFMVDGRVFEVVEELGFFYDSSVVPFWYPGRYRRLSAPREPFSLLPYHDMLEIPVSVLNYVRLPIGLPWINITGSRVFTTMLKFFGTTSPIIFYMHVDDLLGKGLNNLSYFMSFLRNLKVRFITALELADMLSHDPDLPCALGRFRPDYRHIP